MSRIFLSHSSANEIEAVALKQWLTDNGWDDVFLDVDPERGLVAGERWQEALRRAADRCEAVVFVVSPAWARSKWCLAEFLLAKSLHKLIFGVVLEDLLIGELPTEMTAEWQLCYLTGPGSTETIHFLHREKPTEIAFLAEGLKRLKAGLQNAGLSASFFAWPPKGDESRSPYRGLEPLDAQDAAVFFGRDAEILQGLDRLRGMRAAGDQGLFVILGASGAGKSSFLRAGLLPRLARDDRHFYPLEALRPENSPLFGERGLAQAISGANRHFRIAPVNPGEVKAALKEGAERCAALLRNIQSAARARLVALPDDAPLPTLVLPVDQAEELFNADATPEARAFLGLIGTVLRSALAGSLSERRVPLIVAFTIHSDRYEPLQTATEFAGLKTVVFDALKPMPSAQFKEVITGPASRATVGGRRLEVKPDLVQQLLADCAQGADTLPLLGLTLARLYRDYGGDGDLRLDEYQGMGGMTDVIKTEAESILATDPEARKEQLESLHAAFIPWLATVNPDNDQPMRRVARMVDLPAASRPLVQALIEKRLLLSDARDGVPVVEVAHESLLRHWNTLAEWLSEERDDLKEADRLEQAAAAWAKSGQKVDWLMEGERLAIAETVTAKSGYRDRLNPTRAFLRASRQKEEQRREEEERHRQAELVAAQEKQAAAEALAAEQLRATERAQADGARLKKRGRLLMMLVLAAVGIALLAGWFAWKSQQQFKQATALRLTSEAQAMLSGAQAGGAVPGLLKLLAAHRTAPHIEIEAAMMTSVLDLQRLEKIIDSNSPVQAVAYSPDGTRIVSGSRDQTLRLWDARSGQPLGDPMKGHERAVTSVAFSPDGTRLVSGGEDETLRRWDARSGQPLGEPMKGHEGWVTSVAYSPDGTRLVSGSDNGTLRLWDAQSGQPIGAPMKGHEGWVTSVAYSPDGTRLVSGSRDQTLRLWDARSGQLLGEPMQGHGGVMYSVAFSPDGTRIVSGSRDQTLRLWDARSGQPLGDPIKGHEGSVTSVAFSPDGTRLVSGSRDQTLRLWDARSGQPLGDPMKGHESPVTSVAYSPDGTRIVSGSRDQTLRLWDARSGQPLGDPMKGHGGVVYSVAFSPDGTRLVSGGEDKTLRRWDAQSGQPIGAPMKGHERAVTSVAFSPDGTRLVSGSDNGTLRLWDAQSGQPIGAPLRGHERDVTSVAFSPDGTHFVSGSSDKTLRLWPAPKVWPDLLCAKLTHNMSRKEWREWVSADIAYVCQCPGLPILPDEPDSGAKPETCPVGKP